MKKQGFAIIESLVLVVMFVVILSLVFTNVYSAKNDAEKTQSILNLKNLVGTYITGQASRKPMPKSKGHTFWLAMFVGDSAAVEGSLSIDNIYAPPSHSQILISPADKYCKSAKEIQIAFQDAIANDKQGWDQLPGDDRLYTSYAGPRTRRTFTSKEGAVIGCEGSRNGKGFFQDGFCAISNVQSTSFLKYEDLAKETPQEWTGEETEPNWESELLDTVYNVGCNVDPISGSKYDILPETDPEVKPDESVDTEEGTIEKPVETEVVNNENTENKTSNKDDDTGNAMVIIIAIVVLFVILIVLIVLFRSKRK